MNFFSEIKTGLKAEDLTSCLVMDRYSEEPFFVKFGNNNDLIFITEGGDVFVEDVGGHEDPIRWLIEENYRIIKFFHYEDQPMISIRNNDWDY